MFKKLLKYDFLYVARVWWIIAVGTVIAAISGAVALRIIINSPQTHILLTMIAFFWTMISILALSASALGTQVLLYVRFYKHLYSDEGYLTFTLPVKRSTILLSKTVNAVIWTILSFILLYAGVAIMVFTVGGKAVLDEVLRSFSQLFSGLAFSDILWIGIYAFEAILILLTSSWFSVGLVQLCITIGSTITRKHKVLASIGIYYAVNAGVGVISQILMFIAMMCAESLSDWFEALSPNMFSAVIAILLLLVAAVIGGAAFLFHHMTLQRIKNNLNMA